MPHASVTDQRQSQDLTSRSIATQSPARQSVAEPQVEQPSTKSSTASSQASPPPIAKRSVRRAASSRAAATTSVNRSRTSRPKFIETSITTTDADARPITSRVLEPSGTGFVGGRGLDAIRGPQGQTGIVTDSSLADLAWPAVETARSADHIEIHQLLRAAFHAPTTAEFAAQLDEPGYQPSERLVIRHRREIVSHLRLVPRTLEFDGQRVRAMMLSELVTSAPWQRRGLARHLVSAAQHVAREQGVTLLLARTKFPQLFSALRWQEASLQWSSLADARQVLAKLALWSSSNQKELFADDEDAPITFTQGRTPTRNIPVVVRPLRRIDYVSLRELYASAAPTMRGWPVRSDEYWDWLLGKGACDSMLVAAVRDPKAGNALGSEKIVGYAFAREGRLVEHLVLPGYVEAAEQLLARVCSDVLESDRGNIRVDAPLLSPLHEHLRAAGGQTVTPQQTCGQKWMMLPLGAVSLLEKSLPSITARAAKISDTKTATLSLRIGSVNKAREKSAGEVSLRAPQKQFRLQLYRSGVKLVEAAATSPSITLSETCLGMLLLGQWSVESAIARGELDASSAAAAKLAETLFPSQLWHIPPLDDLLG